MPRLNNVTDVVANHPDIPWRDSTYDRLTAEQASKLDELAKHYEYTKPRNTTRSAGWYFFYAVQRVLRR